MNVNIYVLIDPRTLKVRYIGRTRCTLKKRLSEHVCVDRSKSITRVKSWIKSLKSVNSKPYIRLLTTCEGWEESHVLEQQLIEKHKVKHDLLNHMDRGAGNPFPINSDFTRLQISKTLKEGYASGRLKPTRTKEVFVYSAFTGEFIEKYNSISECSRKMNINNTSVLKVLNNTHKKMNGYIFKYEFFKSIEPLKYPTKRKLNILKLYYKDRIVEYPSFRECVKSYGMDVEKCSTCIQHLTKEIFFADKDIEFIESESIGKVARNVGRRKVVEIKHPEEFLKFQSLKEVCKYYNWDNKQFGYKAEFLKKFYKHFPNSTLTISPNKIS